MTESGKQEWLTCPNPECESDEVVINVDHDGAVKFECADCDSSTDYDYDRQWSIADWKKYQGEWDGPSDADGQRPGGDNGR